MLIVLSSLKSKGTNETLYKNSPTKMPWFLHANTEKIQYLIFFFILSQNCTSFFLIIQIQIWISLIKIHQGFILCAKSEISWNLAPLIPIEKLVADIASATLCNVFYTYAPYNMLKSTIWRLYWGLMVQRWLEGKISVVKKYS